MWGLPSLLIVASALAGCGDGESPGAAGTAGGAVSGMPSAAGRYLVSHSVSVPPSSYASLLHLLPSFPSGPLEGKGALEIIGGGAAGSEGNRVFVANNESVTIQRFETASGTFVAGPRI